MRFHLVFEESNVSSESSKLASSPEEEESKDQGLNALKLSKFRTEGRILGVARPVVGGSSAADCYGTKLIKCLTAGGFRRENTG